MPLVWLCQIDAFARDGGAASPIRLASHDDDRLCHLNALTWWPAIARLPTLTYDFFDGAFGGEIVTPSGRAELSIAGVPDFAALMLHGARIRWWSGELGAAWGSFTLRFDGMIDNHPAVRDGTASVEFRVDDRWLDDPILSTYGGTTGAEGEAAQKGQVKPLMLGAPRMVEGVLIDSIDTINQLSDGPIEGVEVAMEDAARFAAPVADYASFAALDAATIAPGFVATGLAVGLVRHGAPGDGVLTYDVKGSNSGADGGGWVRRAGAIVKRLAARQDKLAKVDSAALTALDTARPWNISIALTSQTTMRELVQSIAQSINAVALVTWTGLLTILPVDPPEGATPVGTLASDGSALPPVARVDQLGIAAPWWRVAIEAEVTQRVHGADEIRFTANLVEVGIYDDAETYREGNIASTADGSRWLYTGTTPTAGNDPFDGSAYWSRLGPPASGFTWYAYADAPDGTFNFATGSPGNRAYQGIATGKASATESTDPADYDWSPYVGPPNFGLASFNANTVLAGNKLIKVAGGSAWNASVHSTESFRGGATVSFVVDALGLFMVGLNADPTADADYASIDFAIYVQGAASVLVMESGVNTASTGAAVVGEVFSITYNGKSVVYSRNGVPFHTNNAPTADLTLFLDSSLNAIGQSAHIQSFAAAGPAGAEGAPGAAGLNSAVVYLYRRGATSPATPTGTFTYTFATGVLSGGTLNGWTQAIPAADGNPLWVIAASASASTATDSIAAAEFSAPVLKDGAGLNAATVMLYQRAASTPSVPAGTLTYTFATGALSGTLGSWTQAVPAHNGNPLYLITATAVGTGTTDTIATEEWATPRVIATNGADGAAGAPGTPGTNGTTYYTWYAYADAPDGTFNFTTGSPGDRTYQGVAPGKTTATESVNPADYTWSPYVGPPNFGLAAFNANTVVAGNKLIKVAGGSAWNASVHSTESYKGGASVSFVVDAIGLFMVGLNTDPTTDANYTSLDFAIYVQGGASVLVMEGGVNKASTGAAAIGDVFTVTYNGKSVVYSRNGVSFYTNSAPAANLTLFLDSSLNASGQSARILSFVAAGPAGAEGEPGLTISASPPVLTVARTAGGAPKAGELPKGTQVKVYDGTTDVTGSCSFAKADTGCSVSNGGGGAFSLTAISAEDAYTIVTATYGGRSIPIKIAVAQPRDGSAASRASASVTSMNATATYVAIATVDLVVPNGASVSGSASVTYLAASFVGGGTRTVRQQAKVSIQNLTDSGSEVDGTAQIGSAASYIGGDGPSDVGSVSASASVLNSTGATKTFRLRFYIRYYDGATTAQTAGGTFTGSIEAQAA